LLSERNTAGAAAITNLGTIAFPLMGVDEV
jgi:hypothetical protein